MPQRFQKCMERIAMVRRRVRAASLRPWYINSQAYSALSYIEQYTEVPKDMFSKIKLSATETVMLMGRPMERTMLSKMHDAGLKPPPIDLSARGVASRCREFRNHRENEISRVREWEGKVSNTWKGSSMSTVYDEWRKAEERALAKGVYVDSVYRGLYNHAALNHLGDRRKYARKRRQASMLNRLKGKLGELRKYLTDKFEKRFSIWGGAVELVDRLFTEAELLKRARFRIPETGKYAWIRWWQIAFTPVQETPGKRKKRARIATRKGQGRKIGPHPQMGSPEGDIKDGKEPCWFCSDVLKQEGALESQDDQHETHTRPGKELHEQVLEKGRRRATATPEEIEAEIRRLETLIEAQTQKERDGEGSSTQTVATTTLRTLVMRRKTKVKEKEDSGTI